MFSFSYTKEIKKMKYHSVWLWEMGELLQECFPKNSHLGTARTKYDKETDEEGKKEFKQFYFHKT